MSDPVLVPAPASCCPHCCRTQRQTRYGKNPCGTQRFRCLFCLRDYTASPKPRGYAAELRHQGVRLYLEGLSLRRIARTLSVNHQTVANWVAAYQEQLQSSGQPQLPEDPALAAEGAVVELDELHTFIGAKRGEKNAGSTS